MTYKEKVIKGLECCYAKNTCCSECPYFTFNGPCHEFIAFSALELLKDQKPMPVLDIAESIMPGALVGECPSCGEFILSTIKKPTKFCRYCGQAIDFSDKTTSD